MSCISVDNICPDINSTVEKLKAQFKILFSDDKYEPTEKIEFDGYLTAQGQRYFWGFGPSQDQSGWVFRLDFEHFDFKPEVDYLVGSGGFRALLVKGGSEMISGGNIREGIMRIKKIEPDGSQVEGQFRDVKAMGGRPDGSDMDPAYASSISFISKWQKT